MGVIVSSDDITPEPRHTSSIQNYGTSNIKIGARSFLGLASYHRTYVKNFAQIARSLTSLTKKARPFHWTDECQKLMDDLKRAILEALVLATFGSTLQTQVYVDASYTGLGAVLTQTRDNQE